MDYESWSALTEKELASRDLAALDLAFAAGLPHTEKVDLQKCLARVDEWAEVIRRATRKHLPKFRELPRKYGGTPGKFRMLIMSNVLTRDLGFKYNLPFNDGEYDGRDSRNLFIHGLLTDFGGSCVTMPLMYVALGRRLGYPLHLVATRDHYFVRWEGQGERFNVEATAPGFALRNDAHFREWPKHVTDQEVARGIYLKNLTRRDELAAMVFMRATCLIENMKIIEGLEAHHWACKIAPHNPVLQTHHALATMILMICRNMSVAKGPRPVWYVDRIYQAAPKPTEEWHHWAIPKAIESMRRIRRNQMKMMPFWNPVIEAFCPCDRGIQEGPCGWPGCPKRRELAIKKQNEEFKSKLWHSNRLVPRVKLPQQITVKDMDPTPTKNLVDFDFTLSVGDCASAAGFEQIGSAETSASDLTALLQPSRSSRMPRGRKLLGPTADQLRMIP
jgi:regulator of sirC expression with transglutaminase-like and TPR domain